MTDRATYTLTHQDLAQAVGVSVTTIKSYRRKFPEFFFPPSQTKPLRFRPETRKLCLEISALFEKGLSIQQAKKLLIRSFPVLELSDNFPIDDSEKESPAPLAAELERVTTLLGQMTKGMGAMATAQARFSLETQKEKDRLDTLLTQQAALAERMDTLAAILERLALELEHQAAGPAPTAPRRRVIRVQGQDGSRAYEFQGAQPTPAALGQEASSTTPCPDLRGRGSFQPEPGPSQAPGETFSGPVTIPSSPQDFPDTTPPAFSQDENLPSEPPHEPSPRPEKGQEVPRTSAHLSTNRPDFLGLPAVLRSSRGEYLGLTGRGGHPFSLGELEDYLGTRPDLKPMLESWQGAADHWILTLHPPDSDQGTHAFQFTRTQTPRGNHVALLTQLDVDGAPVTEAFLQAFFRQIKEALITNDTE